MKVKKDTHPEPHEFQPDLADRLSQSAFVQWITDNPKILLYAGIALLALFVIGFRWTTGSWFKAESDYYRAESDYVALLTLPTDEKSPENMTKILNNLEGMIKKHPELHAKYDEQVAQILIAQGKFQEAVPFVTKNSYATPEDESLSFYKQFSDATLSLEKDQPKVALRQALELKQKMLDEAVAAHANDIPRKFGDALFAYNLLRIATIQEKLGDKEGERSAWQEWKKYSALDSVLINPQVFQQLNNQLLENNLSLTAYIKLREEKLSS